MNLEKIQCNRCLLQDFEDVFPPEAAPSTLLNIEAGGGGITLAAHPVAGGIFTSKRSIGCAPSLANFTVRLDIEKM